MDHMDNLMNKILNRLKSIYPYKIVLLGLCVAYQKTQKYSIIREIEENGEVLHDKAG